MSNKKKPSSFASFLKMTVITEMFDMLRTKVKTEVSQMLNMMLKRTAGALIFVLAVILLVFGFIRGGLAYIGKPYPGLDYFLSGFVFLILAVLLVKNE